MSCGLGSSAGARDLTGAPRAPLRSIRGSAGRCTQSGVGAGEGRGHTLLCFPPHGILLQAFSGVRARTAEPLRLGDTASSLSLQNSLSGRRTPPRCWVCVGREHETQHAGRSPDPGIARPRECVVPREGPVGAMVSEVTRPSPLSAALRFPERVRFPAGVAWTNERGTNAVSRGNGPPTAAHARCARPPDRPVFDIPLL